MEVVSNEGPYIYIYNEEEATACLDIVSFLRLQKSWTAYRSLCECVTMYRKRVRMAVSQVARDETDVGHIMTWLWVKTKILHGRLLATWWSRAPGFDPSPHVKCTNLNLSKF